MKTAPIEYLIAKKGKTTSVSGFAIDFPDARICVREAALDLWVVDHYDTGFLIGGHHAAMDDCIEYAIRRYKETKASGLWDKAVAISMKLFAAEGLV